MNKRLLHSKNPGQSIPLIALIIVVLFGMVALSVDVGSTYAQQRAAVRATEAATLSGMTTLLESNNDASVWLAIQNSLRSNGIDVAAYQDGVAQTSDNRLVKAEYLGSDGNPICTVGACSGGNLSLVTYIQVNVDGFNSTYFAKIVGRDTLPIHAQAFAGKCAPTTGVYPLVLSSTLLDSTKFKAPSNPSELANYGLYSSNDYQNVYQRRIYERLTSGSEGYGFVRWGTAASSGNQATIADGLTGDGNMDLGFQEATWPTGTALGSIPKDTSGNVIYPAHPGALNANDSDWIWGTASVNVSTQLAALKNNRTRLLLPITDGSSGTAAASNLEYHVTSIGSFILNGYGTGSDGVPYLDLVFVGNASSVPCNITNVVHTTSLGLNGLVQIRPRYTLPPLAHQPVQYTIVLDVSGSMMWDFYGQARVGSSTNGAIVQCGNSSDPVRAAAFIADDTACNKSPAWAPASERRIAVAKTALTNFIGLMDAYDAMQIIYFSGTAIGNSTSSIWQYGTAAGKQALSDATLAAGAPSKNDPYNVSGGTPSATGLKQARDLIASSPDTSATDGREFKKVVIFMTDGVANYFTEKSNSPFGWLNDSRDNSACKNLSGNTETPSCQIGMTNTTPSYERPITAMGSQARAIKNLNDGNTLIYVVALAGVPATGLSTDVASQSTFPYYSEAVQSSQVQQIFDAINASVENATCIPSGGANWLGNIDGDHTITNASTRSSFGLPSDTSVYGYVYLKNSAGSILQYAPITHANGQLNYSFANVAPGTYKLEAFVGYLGDDSPKPVARVYSSILLPSLEHSTSRDTQVSESATLNSVVTLDPLYLDLNGAVCP